MFPKRDYAGLPDEQLLRDLTMLARLLVGEADAIDALQLACQRNYEAALEEAIKRDLSLGGVSVAFGVQLLL